MDLFVQNKDVESYRDFLHPIGDRKNTVIIKRQIRYFTCLVVLIFYVIGYRIKYLYIRISL